MLRRAATCRMGLYVPLLSNKVPASTMPPSPFTRLLSPSTALVAGTQFSRYCTTGRSRVTETQSSTTTEEGAAKTAEHAEPNELKPVDVASEKGGDAKVAADAAPSSDSAATESGEKPSRLRNWLVNLFIFPLGFGVGFSAFRLFAFYNTFLNVDDADAYGDIPEEELWAESKFFEIIGLKETKELRSKRRMYEMMRTCGVHEQLEFMMEQLSVPFYFSYFEDLVDAYFRIRDEWLLKIQRRSEAGLTTSYNDSLTAASNGEGSEADDEPADLRFTVFERDGYLIHEDHDLILLLAAAIDSTPSGEAAYEAVEEEHKESMREKANNVLAKQARLLTLALADTPTNGVFLMGSELFRSALRAAVDGTRGEVRDSEGEGAAASGDVPQWKSSRLTSFALLHRLCTIGEVVMPLNFFWQAVDFVCFVVSLSLVRVRRHVVSLPRLLEQCGATGPLIAALDHYTRTTPSDLSTEDQEAIVPLLEFLRVDTA